MKYQRMISIVLALSMVLCALPCTVMGAAMTASEDLIQFIKGSEGFTEYAHWDYQHYSIGYGTQCSAGQYPNGISRAEADALLRRFVADAEKSVNSFVSKNSMNPSQQEYDCMVSLTYGLGVEWMKSSYDLPKLFIDGCTELELLNTMGGWVTAQGQTLNGLIYRRMRETYIYCHGIYNASDNIAKDVPYACVKFDPNGGSVAYKRVYSIRGEAYGKGMKLPVPTRSGYYFAGWFDSSGNQITDNTIAKTALMTVTARWDREETLFSDVHGSDWFYQDVKRAATMGLFTGYTDGSFQPNATMNRAMFAQVLYRIAGQPDSDASLPFTDVPKNAWYYDAVRWAYGKGIVNGTGANRFAPNDTITREQMATMLYKYCKLATNADVTTTASLSGYADSSAVSGFAVEPMQWAVSAGLINGTSATTLSPKYNATRAQAATILVRLTTILDGFVA